MWEREGCTPKYTTRIGGHRFFMAEFKGKPRVILEVGNSFKPNKPFHSNQVISPSEARRLIAWLARYIAMSDPDPVSLAIASTKTHAKLIQLEQDRLAKELGVK
jgi:hypothetical protein